MNPVLCRPAPSPADVVRDLSFRSALETDCHDVHTAFAGGDPGFVLLHVVGTPETYARRHVPNAVFLPHRLITEERMAEWPRATLFVVYCSGPHCNGAEQGALALAGLGRPVKIMIGGIMGWEFEGFDFAHGA